MANKAAKDEDLEVFGNEEVQKACRSNVEATRDDSNSPISCISAMVQCTALHDELLKHLLDICHSLHPCRTS